MNISQLISFNLKILESVAIIGAGSVGCLAALGSSKEGYSVDYGMETHFSIGDHQNTLENP
ncbi:CBM_HP2_G0000860.mRNA.1.CDS.1 [Saccharomyces cerevisiae]|nr:CBM_HP2_G0000860.mRNA.1.CDS.1 [Saccharomyces cerevisiae]CAI6384912.1 CBM_HP2_G0000860.mRNA.1.CDS.1 [Saccharomyces cerevisiae]